MMSQEHAFVLAIETLLNISTVNNYTNYIRVLFDELTRILNHMLAIACHALDIGSMSSIFWAFEEREKIMEFYERVCGARMHAAFHKPVNLFSSYLPNDFLQDILFFVQNCYTTLNEMHNVLTYNKVWKQRLINIGTINSHSCETYNLTGVMARSCGIRRDLRLSIKDSYSGYNKLFFKGYYGINGDCFDRYLIRMLEMAESLQLVNVVSYNLLQDNVNLSSLSYLNNLFYNKKNVDSYSVMEDLINHFLQWHSGIQCRDNSEISLIESGKGEFGVSLVTTNTTKPWKCKVKSPSYYNLQFLPQLSKGHYLADIAAIIGTIDVVFGEIDR